LSYIPGSVGAGVFQNIAAYGQNFDETFLSLEAINLKTGKLKTFKKDECKFGYRESIFKKSLHNKYIITSVKLKLSVNGKIDTSYHSRYGSLLDELSKFAKPPYTGADIAKAVTNIRKFKMPDWKKTGTAGSFFLNPVVSKKKLSELQRIVPDVQYYPIDELTYPAPDDPKFNYSDHVKVAAGWLLEELGWKGKRIGNIGTSPNQAMVLLNYGGATAAEIVDFAKRMQDDFEEKYKIKLEPEVNII
jgi:UDP-N-acetylmuramate dehydrogenase